MRGLFITGTDTNVGKTVVSAALMHRYRGLKALRYWKPMQTGSDSDTAEVQRLGACADHEILDKGIRLPLPASPHLAAEQAGVRIDLDELHALLPDDNVNAGIVNWIVEGAGGVLVPVNESQTMADWMVQLQLPVVLAARTALGTINHTLLTLEALRTRKLRVAGVVMIGEPNAANRTAIEHYGGVHVLGEMPTLAPLNATTLGEWSREHLDPEARLAEFFA